jgi:hypothetical protein
MFSIALGVFLWCGVFFRWRWLVDPPIDKPLDLIWSQARLKSMFGTTAVIIFTYLLGAVSIFYGLLDSPDIDRRSAAHQQQESYLPCALKLDGPGMNVLQPVCG